MLAGQIRPYGARGQVRVGGYSLDGPVAQVTGYTGPVNPLASRLTSSSLPTLPGLSLAPTSAIDAGRRNGPTATRAAAGSAHRRGLPWTAGHGGHRCRT